MRFPNYLNEKEKEGKLSMRLSIALKRNVFMLFRKILRPDIVIFLTGPKETKYCNYIKENFNVIGEPIALSGLPIGDVSKLQLEGVKSAYLTHHPGYSPKDANAFHWKLYDAILKDIKENIDKLLKKE